MLKRLSTIAAALVISTVSAVEAAPKTGTFEDHQNLWAAIASTGTVMKLNTPECLVDDAPDGYYSYNSIGDSAFVVCQDDADSATQVDWTENDLDTLRHEAIHLIQDCAHGTRADGILYPLGTGEEIMNLVDNSIGREFAKEIVEHYRSHVGLTDEAQLMTEVEAFSAAASVNANVLATMATEACAAQ